MTTGPRQPTLGATVAMTPPPAAAPGRWTVDAAESVVQISVSVGFLVTVTGTFTDVRGHVEVAADVRDSRIAVEVRTGSLTSGSSYWDSVLLAAGLLDSVTNPTLSFESTGITAHGGQFQLDGLLVTARGCLPVRFDLSCLTARDDRVRFRATGKIATTDAVRLLSHPGVDRLIGKTMTVDLEIAAVHRRNGA